MEGLGRDIDVVLVVQHMVEQRAGQMAARSAACYDSHKGEDGVANPIVHAQDPGCEVNLEEARGTGGKYTEKAWRINFTSEMES